MTVLSSPASAFDDALVREHLPLVRRAVSDLSARMPRHVSRDDLYAAGLAGLAQAARAYDPSRGVPFRSYAMTRVRGALLDELRVHDWASRPVRAKARKLDDAAERLTARHGRQPTIDEVAGELGVAPNVVVALRHDVHRATVQNYDAIVNDGDADSVMLSDSNSPEGVILDRERHAYLFDAVAALSARLQRVVIGYFFENLSMAELGAELGVSESRISQLRTEALDLLRDGINTHLEPDAVPAPGRPGGRVDRRRNAYFEQVAAQSSPAERVSGHRPSYARD